MGYETTWMDTFVFFQLKCWEITSRDGNQERRSLSGDQCTALHLKDFHLEPYLTASLNLWYILQRHANTLSNIYIYIYTRILVGLLYFCLCWNFCFSDLALFLGIQRLFLEIHVLEQIWNSQSHQIPPESQPPTLTPRMKFFWSHGWDCHGQPLQRMRHTPGGGACMF